MVCGIDPYEDEACPDERQRYINCTIIRSSSKALDWLGYVVDDWIYADFDDDSDEEDDGGDCSTSESE